MTTFKRENCNFSGRPIYPGHGRKFVPYNASATTPALRFGSSKALRLFKNKKNPRKLCWTVVYRIAHHKGASDAAKKRKSVRVKRTVRAYIGRTLESMEATKSKHLTDEQRKTAQAELEAQKRAAKLRASANKPKTTFRSSMPVASKVAGKGR